jgi:hypothetical protein
VYTYDQVLYFSLSGGKIAYRVANRGKFVPWPWRRIDSLGKIASQYRKLGEKAARNALPELPDAVWESILAIAAHQDGWAEREAAKEAERLAAEEKYANVGEWD